jgi:hypothetical protein
MLLIAAALCAALGAWAQTSTVTLQNQEPSVLWFAVDPPGLEDVSVGSRQLEARVAEYFSQESADFPFQSLAPDTPITLSGLSQGTHLVVGFFLVEGGEDLPVRAFSVQVDAGTGDRFYALFSGPALLTIPRSAARLAGLARAGQMAEAPVEEPVAEEVAVEEPVAEEPPVEEVAVEEPVAEEVAVEEPGAEEVAVEEPVAEEVAVEEPVVEEVGVEEAVVEEPPAPADEPAQVAAFSPAYSPVVFTRESKSGFTVLPIAQSRFWGEPGTRLESVEGIVREGVLELTLRTQDGFSAEVSYFFYVFAERALGRENAVTFELLPLSRGGQGAFVLWQKPDAPAGAPSTPLFVGTVTTWGRSCTVSLPLADLPARTLEVVGQGPSLDLSSCRYDARGASFEEFYFTSLELADFPGAATGPVTR